MPLFSYGEACGRCALRGKGEFPDRVEGLAAPSPNRAALYDACFRIAKESRRSKLVVENVKGAQPWVGKARAHCWKLLSVGRRIEQVGRECDARFPPVFGGRRSGQMKGKQECRNQRRLMVRHRITQPDEPKAKPRWPAR